MFAIVICLVFLMCTLKPTFTSKLSLSLTTVQASVYNAITVRMSHSSTPSVCKAHLTTFLGTLYHNPKIYKCIIIIICGQTHRSDCTAGWWTTSRKICTYVWHTCRCLKAIVGIFNMVSLCSYGW